jgi:hypothetical protein
MTLDDIARLLAAHGQRRQELAQRLQAAALAAMSRGALDLDLAHGALDAGWPKLTDWAMEWPAPWRYGRN